MQAVHLNALRCSLRFYTLLRPGRFKPERDHGYCKENKLARVPESSDVTDLATPSTVPAMFT